MRAIWVLALLFGVLAIVGVRGAAGDPAESPVACDWGTTVEDQLIAVSSFQTDAQTCGVEKLENDAYDLYADSHDIPRGDDRITQAGQPEIAGTIWALLRQIVLGHSNTPSALTSDQRGAYDWLEFQTKQADKMSAQDAINEYNRWSRDPCNYLPPNSQLFSFVGVLDPACAGTLSSLFEGPAPPSYEELTEMGHYDAEQTLGIGIQGTKYAKLNLEQAGEGAASWGAVLLGVTGPIIDAINPDALGGYTRLIAPAAEEGFQNRITELNSKLLQANEKLMKLQNLAEEGELENPADLEAAEDALSDLVDEGVDLVDEVAAYGPEMLGGPFAIIGAAVAVLVQESIKISDEVKLPGELQSSLDTANGEKLDDLFNTGGGYADVWAVFQSLLTIPDPTVGTPGNVTNSVRRLADASLPSDGSEFEVEQVDDSGTTRSVAFQPTVTLATWPLGSTQGSLGVPQETFALYRGQVWHTLFAHSDEADAGLSGFIPSGEIHYYDWSGHPRLAMIDGDKFVDLGATGTVDLGGADASPDPCPDGATASCDIKTSIEALVSAGGMTKPSSSLGTSDGSVAPPYWKVRLVMKPNPGAPAVINDFNRYGKLASTDTVPPDGGLHAGDTVTFTDPLSHPFGFATTYTWKIESRCAYQATCTADSDAAFHGNPTVTKTGQTVTYTWPAPGVYHVRLSTTDDHGVTKVSDQDFTVVGTAPSVALSSTAGLAGASVYGPIANGDTLSITGCVTSSTGAYGTPKVTVDWGDGASETHTAPTGSSTLSFHYGTVSGCSQPWQFTATHQYQLANPNHVFEQQKQLQIDVTDGFGNQATRSPAVNVQFASAPTISSANNVTFLAGRSQTFPVTATGLPAPTISVVSGALPSGVVFERDAHGNYSIGGIAVDGGTYNLQLQAVSSQGIATQSFTFTVQVQPTITSASSFTLAANHAASIQLTSAGFPAATLSVSGTLPSGLSFDPSTASIVGTPSADSVGTYPLQVKATNAAGTSIQNIALTVGTGPAFTTGTSAGFVVGAASSNFLIAATGFPKPSYSCAAPCDLPAGLQFHDVGDGTAEIYGSATGSESDQVTITATSAAGSAQQTITVTASLTGGPNVTVSQGGSPVLDGKVNVVAGTAITPIDVSATPAASLAITGNLPVGLAFHDNGDGTGTISGTPQAGSGGSYGLALIATPSVGSAGLAFLGLDVYAPPTVTSAATAVFVAGESSSFIVTASGLPAVALSLAGTLPSGLTFTENGDGTAVIGGAPDASTVGDHDVTIESENLLSEGHPLETTLTIEVDQSPTLTSASSIYLGDRGDGTFTVRTTGTPAPALTVVGTMPAGISFRDNGNGTGTFSGTPTDPVGTTNTVTIVASSTAGVATQDATIAIGRVPTFSSDDTALFAVGANGSFTVASDTTPAPTFEADGLPAGLSLRNNGDGTATISGTPAAGTGETHPVTVTATNDYGSTLQTLRVVVAEAPTFLGTEVANCSSTDPTTSATFLGPSSWTLCASGYPKPTMSLAGRLPDGITFTNNADGTARIAGTAETGSGGDYPVTLIVTNASGSVAEALDLQVDEQAGTNSTNATFLAGTSNSVTIRASGTPTPSFQLTTFGTAPPSWLQLTDNHDGTATLSGTPPLTDVGTDVSGSIRLNQTVGNGGSSTFDIQVAPLVFTAADPTGGALGSAYSYAFASTDPSATFAVPDGDGLPDGLTLSSSGVLSGMPTSAGTFRFHVVATDSQGSVESDVISMDVSPGSHALEISAFRVYGPQGRGDWFLTARNQTSSTLRLVGWDVDVYQAGSSLKYVSPLPDRTLAPGAEVTVSGPYFSLSPLVSSAGIGPSLAATTGGFALVAPDGSVEDKAGEVGVAAAGRAGTGVPVPTGSDATAQSAFVRHSSGDTLVDTGDNASDFTYTGLLRAQALAFTSSPSDPVVGTTYTVRVSGGGSSSPVTLGASGTCSLSGSTVTFTAVGVCVIGANQSGDIRYAAAPSVTQAITVRAAASPATPVTVTSAVTQTVTAAKAATLTVGTGASAVSVTVPAGAVSAPATVNVTTVTTTPKSSGITLSAGVEPVQLVVTSQATGDPITHFDTPVEIVFAAPSATFKPAYSTDAGLTWTEIPRIVAPPALPSGWPDGWYRSGDDIHVLTRHATYYALVTPGSRTIAALRLGVSAKTTLSLRKSHKLALRYQVTLPGTVTLTLRRGKTVLGAWHAKSTGSVQTVTITLPAKARKAGTETLTVRAAAGSELATKTISLKLRR